MSYSYQPRGGYSGTSNFAQEQMIRDLIDRVNAILEQVTILTKLITPEVVADITAIADEILADDEPDENVDPSAPPTKDLSGLDLGDLVRPGR